MNEMTFGMKTLNLKEFKSPKFQENFNKNDMKGLFNLCALCGKVCKTWKVSFLIDGDLNEAVLLLGDATTLEKFFVGAPLGFFSVGSDCARRLTPEAKTFLYTNNQREFGRMA